MASAIEAKDLERTFAEFSDFTLKEMKKAIRGALGEVGKKVKKSVQDEFIRDVPAATHSNPKYNDRLIDAVRMSVSKTSNSQNFSKVHVMGTKDPGSGTFRARFFNQGTVRGDKQIIKPYKFF